MAECTVHSPLATDVVIALLAAGAKPGSPLDLAMRKYLRQADLPSALDRLGATPLVLFKGKLNDVSMPFGTKPQPLPATLEQLNAEVARLTAGTITNAYQPSAMNANLLLLCCVAFKRDFYTPFGKPVPGKFTRADGMTVDCLMMSQESDLATGLYRSPYSQVDFTVVDVHYHHHKNCKLRLALPTKKDVVPVISDHEWSGIAYCTFDFHETRLTIPPWTCRARHNLLDRLFLLFPELRKPGALDGFFPGAAIDDAFQDAFIEVTETGTHAGAVASCAVMKSAGGFKLTKPREVVFDHPFAYAIIDGTDVLISGTVTSA